MQLVVRRARLRVSAVAVPVEVFPSCFPFLSPSSSLLLHFQCLSSLGHHLPLSCNVLPLKNKIGSVFCRCQPGLLIFRVLPPNILTRQLKQQELSDLTMVWARSNVLCHARGCAAAAVTVHDSSGNISSSVQLALRTED